MKTGFIFWMARTLVRWTSDRGKGVIPGPPILTNSLHETRETAGDHCVSKPGRVWV